jgi:hypothetical protein
MLVVSPVFSPPTLGFLSAVSRSLLVMREAQLPFDLHFVKVALRSFPDIQRIREQPASDGCQRLIADCGTGNDACELWLDDGGIAIHIMHPGVYGEELARQLHQAFIVQGLGGLELCDQAYTFHVRLQDGLDIRQAP